MSSQRLPNRLALIVHGGAGNSLKNIDGCQAAAEAGFTQLLNGSTSLEAAVTAVTAMENDGRFNAGSGSTLRLDGKTIEMDAAVMDTRNHLGAVASIQHVKNPILVANAVTKTPHWLLVGEGALRFAKMIGFSEHQHLNEKAKAGYKKLMQRMRQDPENDQWLGTPNAFFVDNWNYQDSWQNALDRLGSSTVGAVALDTEGHFAVATSTGGCAPALMGRVGDVPIVGCGFYVGRLGAIAATGIGEYIVKQTLTHTVYRWLEDGMPLQQALDQGVALFPEQIDIGLIGITFTDTATSSNREMPTYTLQVTPSPSRGKDGMGVK